MTDPQLPIQITPAERRLTAAEFQGLAEVPTEIEWFNNISNPGTKRIYKIAIGDFMRFTGIVRPEEFRIVTRAHVIAWRDDLERRGLEGPTRRNRLAALSSLFEYLCEKNALSQNPVKGVKRPKAESSVGTTPTNRRSPGPSTSRGAREGNRQSQTRPRHPVDAPISRAAARRAV